MADLTKSTKRATNLASVFLALLFLFAGGTKLAGVQSHVEQFAHWGYPGWFMYVVGTVEVAGALALLIPATRFWGGLLLACDMAGAVGTHLVARETMRTLLPAMFFVSSASIAWITRQAANAGVETRQASSP
jgi:putative oxidoreductase